MRLKDYLKAGIRKRIDFYKSGSRTRVGEDAESELRSVSLEKLEDGARGRTKLRKTDSPLSAKRPHWTSP